MSEQRPSGLIHIMVALIGVVGSLGVAWMTTQAKFARELDSKASELHELKVQLDAAERRLSQQQQDMDRKVAAVEDRLKRLDTQIETAKTMASSLINAGSGLFGGKKKQ